MFGKIYAVFKNTLSINQHSKLYQHIYMLKISLPQPYLLENMIQTKQSECKSDLKHYTHARKKRNDCLTFGLF